MIAEILASLALTIHKNKHDWAALTTIKHQNSVVPVLADLPFTMRKDVELVMSSNLLKRCSVRTSQHRYKEINPLAYRSPSDLASIEPIARDIPAVDITMPESDWLEIVKIVEAWQSRNDHPAVRDAWDQYQMIRHLTK